MREELWRREERELPVEFLPELSARSRAKGILFGCTPFYLKPVEGLLPYVDFYKVASYGLLWDDLLRGCAQTGKSVVLSTGMATLDEIGDAMATLMNTGCGDLTIPHFVSGYPASAAECNLSAIGTIRVHFRSSPFFSCLRFGCSDHSVSPGVFCRTLHKWGAVMVEFQLDLEGEGEEFHTGHCWLSEQILFIIAAVCDGFSTDGNGEKMPRPVEMGERDWRAEPGDGLRQLRNVWARWRP